MRKLYVERFFLAVVAVQHTGDNLTHVACGLTRKHAIKKLDKSMDDYYRSIDR